MNSYNICDNHNNSSVTYGVYDDKVLMQIFNERVKMLLAEEQNFKLGGESLEKARNKFENIIRLLLWEREKPIINRFPSNDIEGEIFDKKVDLNLRNPIDATLFWYGAIYRIFDDAYKGKRKIKFLFNNGNQAVNNFCKVDLVII